MEAGQLQPSKGIYLFWNLLRGSVLASSPWMRASWYGGTNPGYVGIFGQVPKPVCVSGALPVHLSRSSTFTGCQFYLGQVCLSHFISGSSLDSVAGLSPSDRGWLLTQVGGTLCPVQTLLVGTRGYGGILHPCTRVTQTPLSSAV